MFLSLSFKTGWFPVIPGFNGPGGQHPILTQWSVMVHVIEPPVLFCKSHSKSESVHKEEPTTSLSQGHDVTINQGSTNTNLCSSCQNRKKQAVDNIHKEEHFNKIVIIYYNVFFSTAVENPRDHPIILITSDPFVAQASLMSNLNIYVKCKIKAIILNCSWAEDKEL